MVMHSVGVQLEAHPGMCRSSIRSIAGINYCYLGYGLVTSGHSLGGALASVAAMTLKANFPFSNVTMYTYGGRQFY